METENTIKDQLLKLPQGYRELAIKNYESCKEDGYGPQCDYHIYDTGSAIDRAFIWSGTPEGEDFWHNVWKHYGLNYGSPLPPLPGKDDRATKTTACAQCLGKGYLETNSGDRLVCACQPTSSHEPKEEPMVPLSSLSDTEGKLELALKQNELLKLKLEDAIGGLKRWMDAFPGAVSRTDRAFIKEAQALLNQVKL